MSSSNSNNDNRNTNAYSGRHQRRPEPCRFYNIGQCIYGDNCRFSHDDNIIPISNSGRSNSLSNVQNQRQRPQSVNDNATSYSNRVCRYYQNGHCRNGNNCPFVHEMETTTNPNYQATTLTNDQSKNNEDDASKQDSQSLPTSPSSTNSNQQDHNNNLDDENDDERNCCGICFENIIESKARFGLLLNCSHVFCLNCIMTWRDQHNVSNTDNTNNNNRNQQQPNEFTTTTTSRDNNNRPTVTATMSNGNSISATIIGGRINTNNNNNINDDDDNDNDDNDDNNDEIRMEEFMAQNMARSFISSMYPGLPLPPVLNPFIPMQSQLSNDEDAFIQNMMSSIGNFMENIADNNSRPTQETTHACPVCRKSSKFVIPSYKFIESKEEKLAYFEQCKQKKGKIKCKHFNGNLGSCPFGKECFYAHFDRNGVDVKEHDFRRGSRPHRNGRNGNRSGRGGNARGGRRSGFRGGLIGLPPEIAAFGAGMEEHELDTLHIFSELVGAGLIGGDMDMQGPYSFRERSNIRINSNVTQARSRQDRENDDYTNSDDDDDSSHDSLPVLLRRDYDGSSSSDDSSDESMPPLLIRRGDDDSSSSDDSGDESMPSLSNRTNCSMENGESSDGEYNDDDSCVGMPPLLQQRSDDDSSDDEDIHVGVNRSHNELRMDVDVPNHGNAPSLIEHQSHHVDQSDEEDSCADMPPLIVHQLNDDSSFDDL